MKTIRLLLCSLFFVLSICSAKAEDAAVKRIKVGMIIPLSGSYAAGGIDNRQGIEAALAVSAGAPLFDIIYEDSKADPMTGISEFRKLTGTDGVSAVFVMRGAVGMALNPISQNLKIPLLGAVGNKNFAATNIFAFQVWSKSDDEGVFLARKFRERNYKKAAVITVQDDWQGAVSDEFRKLYPGDGTKIAFDQEVVPNDLDFRTQLSQMKALVPDVIFANLALSQLGPFLRQAKELNVTTQIYSNFWVAKKDVIESAGVEPLEGVRYIEMKTDLPVLSATVAEKYSATPSGAILSGYASTLLLHQVVSKNPNIHSKEELYAALLQQTEIQTPDGPIPIQDRCVKFPLVEKVLRQGKVEIEKVANQ